MACENLFETLDPKGVAECAEVNCCQAAKSSPPSGELKRNLFLSIAFPLCSQSLLVEAQKIVVKQLYE